ncbi:MAG: TIGR02391 family protein [Promethearchaeota archaeon]
MDEKEAIDEKVKNLCGDNGSESKRITFEKKIVDNNGNLSCQNCGDNRFPDQLVEIFNCCPTCGELYNHTKEKIEKYFRFVSSTNKLDDCLKLILKSELRSAVRDACIVLEKEIRILSGLNSHGVDLASKAFSFKYDSIKNEVIQKPKIMINELTTETLRNEQEGIKFLTMGIFKGIRNIYMHTKGSQKIYHCLQVISVINFVLGQIIGEFGTVAEDRSFFHIDENGNQTPIIQHEQ